tara:strand:+ start:101 stop:277 length:177 start_codon:yes stop_codon:yes gene_type:complete
MKNTNEDAYETLDIMFTLVDYVDWERIVKDYDLKNGDFSLEQELTLGKVLLEYVNQNK